MIKSNWPSLCQAGQITAFKYSRCNEIKRCDVVATSSVVSNEKMELAFNMTNRVGPNKWGCKVPDMAIA